MGSGRREITGPTAAGERARPGRRFPRPRGKPGRTTRFQRFVPAPPAFPNWLDGARTRSRHGCGPDRADCVPQKRVSTGRFRTFSHMSGWPRRRGTQSRGPGLCAPGAANLNARVKRPGQFHAGRQPCFLIRENSRNSRQIWCLRPDFLLSTFSFSAF